LCLWYIYTVWGILKHTCRVAGCEAESLVSKYMYICFDCLVRIFWRAAAHVGDRGVVTWHDFTWRGREHIILLPTHPPTWSCTYARLFWPTSWRWWWHAARWLHLVHGGLASPPSIDWVAHTRYHSPIQFSILIVISNINVISEFQSKLYWTWEVVACTALT
jgi:hypothetical protein